MELEVLKVEVCELIVFGVISDSSNEEVLSNAMVTVYNSNKVIVSREITDGSGGYLFKVPLIDNYRVVCKKQGFKKQEFSISGLDQNRNQINQLNINFEKEHESDTVEKKRKQLLKTNKYYELV
ncbi:carboxypeptidase-like regulatory domain-containing protein [Flavobacterium sp. '19STA2R22 D10 B1']|uniref:carboxypeptidase-like regulatory domain-containing protein n=1 Tax=Flavobacterium aerium TaxID=3037261 RepID=UPI00278BED26|nr:carboxypeptidase-like regulatory domain-containing protein [Flavobacterium sp. '19STA2R22 D10 B1']